MNRLVRFDPFRDVASLHDELDRVFRTAAGSSTTPSTAGSWAPALDVAEDEHSFHFVIELPGVRAEDVDVSIEDDVLSVTGERSFYEDRERDGFRRIERHFGRFHRAVRLPDRVDATGVEATYADGLLTITVPKAEEARPRRIEVKTA